MTLTASGVPTLPSEVCMAVGALVTGVLGTSGDRTFGWKHVRHYYLAVSRIGFTPNLSVFLRPFLEQELGFATSCSTVSSRVQQGSIPSQEVMLSSQRISWLWWVTVSNTFCATLSSALFVLYERTAFVNCLTTTFVRSALRFLSELRANWV